MAQTQVCTACGVDLPDACIDKLKAEIAKCDVRCANCHQRRTARERGHWLLDKMDGSE